MRVIGILIGVFLSSPLAAQQDASVSFDSSTHLEQIGPQEADLIIDASTADTTHDAAVGASSPLDANVQELTDAAADAEAASHSDVVEPAGSSNEETSSSETAEPAAESSEAHDRQTEILDPRPHEDAPAAERPSDQQMEDSAQVVFGSPAHVEEVEPNGSSGIELDELLPSLPRTDEVNSLKLLFLVLLAGFLSWLSRRFRARMPSRGLIPIAIGVVGSTANIFVALLGLMLLSRFVPTWLNPTLRWILLAAAAALGWSIRDLLPDLLGGLVLSLERRIKVGVWVAGQGFSGLIETKGLRAIWVRDAHGHLISIPNRRLLVEPIQTDTGIGVGHEVILRLKTDASSNAIRQAIHDAILSSPWVPPSVRPQVLRDTADPTCWRVRCRLLEPDHALHFEGELLERVEDVLAHTASPNPTDGALTTKGHDQLDD